MITAFVYAMQNKITFFAQFHKKTNEYFVIYELYADGIHISSQGSGGISAS